MEELTHIEDGLAVLKRGGTYHARVKIDGKYVYRTLKTGDFELAKKAAQKLLHKFEFSAEHGIPINPKTFGDVIDDYVAFREAENRHKRTSDGMLRQIKRVTRFWKAFAGERLVTMVGDKELRDYPASALRAEVKRETIGCHASRQRGRYLQHSRHLGRLH
ncbi:MAG: hypothetical protein Q8L54_14395 [Devosia sp.]|nr:hypothetical protein [Devosia sp.]